MAMQLTALQAELRTLAAGYLRGERRNHTLQPTALVNEACLRVLRTGAKATTDRAQLLGAAATMMRRILVDHARRRTAARRGGGRCSITFDESVVPAADSAADVLAIDEALQRLSGLDARQARIVELRFFGGLSDDAIGAALGVSRRTVQGDWSMARAWLRRELAGGARP
ncbi:MAG: sigma-70 family RNA polymerase sigma factor [Planctomycetes bacterium]|nr:sigma-70 family RNA polymerase sigma factor [Planctomycetota bacterium]